MEIFDNFISEDQANLIEEYFSNDQIWVFLPKTSGTDHPRLNTDPKIVDSGHNVHMICDNNQVVNLESYSIILPVLESINFILNRKNFIPTSIHRIKVNTTFPNNRMTLDTYGCPHLDSKHYSDDEFRNFTFLYYINESDGDTFLFDLTYTKKYRQEYNNYKIVSRVSPKKNRCFFFESNTLHSGNSPIKFDYRQVINIIVTCQTQ